MTRERLASIASDVIAFSRRTIHSEILRTGGFLGCTRSALASKPPARSQRFGPSQAIVFAPVDIPLSFRRCCVSFQACGDRNNDIDAMNTAGAHVASDLPQ